MTPDRAREVLRRSVLGPVGLTVMAASVSTEPMPLLLLGLRLRLDLHQ